MSNDDTTGVDGVRSDIDYLDGTTDVWWTMTLGTVFTCGFSYFVAGCVAARASGRWHAYIWVPVVGAVVGSAFGRFTGAVPAFLLTLMYNTIPYRLSSRIAGALGTAQGLLIVYLQHGRGF